MNFVEHIIADAALVTTIGDGLPKSEYITLANHMLEHLAATSNGVNDVIQEDVLFIARILQATGGWHGDGACVYNPRMRKGV